MNIIETVGIHIGKTSGLQPTALNFLFFQKKKVALVDWGLSIYKGSLFFTEEENDSIFIASGNLSTYIGYNIDKRKCGIFADANALSIGYDGKYIDFNFSIVGVGFILGFEDEKFRFKIDSFGWFGFDISIDFVQIIKDVFGCRW